MPTAIETRLCAECFIRTSEDNGSWNEDREEWLCDGCADALDLAAEDADSWRSWAYC